MEILLTATLVLIPIWMFITWMYGRMVRDWKPEPIDTLPFTWPELEEQIALGNVSVRVHPDDPSLKIYNYTKQAQYERIWNPVTEACRGLIIQKSKVKARPFSKFYNLGEVDSVPDLPFVAYNKEDGSLGIPYLAPDKRPAIATRGSFTSDQAVWATNFLRQRPAMEDYVRIVLEQGITPLFEIIYPENRIVLNYGDRQDLILLAWIDNKTGKDTLPSPTRTRTLRWPGSVAEVYVDLTLDDLPSQPSENREGFVLGFDDGTRLKYKFDQYVELHRIMTGLTSRKIWEMVSQNIGVERAKEWVPDEFYQWMKGVADDLRRQFTEIEQKALKIYSQVPPLDPEKGITRKEQAEFILKQPHSDIVFNMLDNKEYKDKIWKMIYPPADTAKVSDDAS